MKKKVISIVCVGALAAALLAGCGSSSSTTTTAASGDTTTAAAEGDTTAASGDSSASTGSSKVAMVNGDSWVSGYWAALLLNSAIAGNKVVDKDGNAIWIDDLEPFDVTADTYEDYMTYFVNDEQGLYTTAETQAFLEADYDTIYDAIEGYNFEERIEAKKAAEGQEQPTVESTGNTIAYNIFGSGSSSLDYLSSRTQQACDQCGVETVLKNDNFTAENIITDFMEVINSGKVQGVCIWAPAAGLITPIAEACEEAHVYFTLSDKVPSDAKEELMGMEYFAGAVGPDNAVYGQKMAEYANDQGWTTCVVTTSAEGDTSDQPRYDAFVENFKGEILSTVNNDTTDASLENVRNALNALSDAPDFIYGVGSTYALTALTALDDHADWGTKIITSGLEDDIIKHLAD